MERQSRLGRPETGWGFLIGTDAIPFVEFTDPRWLDETMTVVYMAEGVTCADSACSDR